MNYTHAPGGFDSNTPMKHSLEIYMHVFMPLLFVLMASFFIFIALKTLLGRRPLLFSARWLFGFMCVAFTPSIVNSFMFGFPRAHTSLILLMSPAMFAVMLVFFWLQMRGYMAFAISDAYFREALLSSAASLEFTIEETMSCVKIKETGQEIQVSIQGWTGTAQIKPSRRDSAAAVAKIAAGMNQYFKTSAGKMNYVTSYFYLIIGAFMIAFSLIMTRIP